MSEWILCPQCKNPAVVIKQYGIHVAWIFCESCKYDGVIRDDEDIKAKEGK